MQFATAAGCCAPSCAAAKLAGPDISPNSYWAVSIAPDLAPPTTMPEELQRAVSTSGSSPSAEALPASIPSNHPTVSLCIPAFQAERHLQATIDSALGQNNA